MVINNYEINSTYPNQQPESHLGKVILIIVILGVAGFLYFSFGQKKAEAPVQQPKVEETQPATNTAPAPEEVSLDDLSASVSAALESDTSDMDAIDVEFK